MEYQAESNQLSAPWRLPLRRWQQEAFAAWSQQRARDALIVATPGAGKTRFATRLSHALLSEGTVRRVIAVVPREHLKRQLAAAMAGAGVHLDSAFENGHATLAGDMHGAVVTYQQLAAAPRLYRSLARVPTLAILDEVHHAGDRASWGTALRYAFDEAAYRVGMSGTPFRSDGTAIPFVEYTGGESRADYAYDYTQALHDGVCRPLVFPLQGGYAEWVSANGLGVSASFDTALHSRVQQSERLRTVLTQENWLGDVIVRAHAKLLELRRTQPEAGGLAVAMNQQHARFIAGLMRERIGIAPAIVLSDEDGSSRKIGAFGRSRDPWIVAVHMVSEGVDIPRLRVGIFATNVNTEMYFRQFCGRFVRTQRLSGLQHAFVYLPDDPRLRELASRITREVRVYLKSHSELDLQLEALRERDGAGAESLFAGISAHIEEGRLVDYGPLFNPAAYYADSAAPRPQRGEGGDAPAHDAPTKSEQKASLRRALQALVSQASSRFHVEHRKIHATLNERFGGPIASATAQSIERRRAAVVQWLERDRYDGLR
jgi:superfamily II DNA or RNA helicase